MGLGSDVNRKSGDRKTGTGTSAARDERRRALDARSCPRFSHVNGHPARGFALLEATAALFVIAVGLFGVIQMFQYGVGTLHTIQEHSIASRSLQNEVESLRGLPFDRLEPGTRLDFISGTPEMARLLKVSAWVDIQDREEAPGQLVQVTVSLRWTGEHGRRIKRSVTTLIARKDSL